MRPYRIPPRDDVTTVAAAELLGFLVSDFKARRKALER